MQITGQDQHTLYSAITFRLLLDSLARPGKIHTLQYPHFLGQPPAYYSQAVALDIPVNFYALGALLTLLDGEVSFAVAADAQWQASTSPIVQWLVLRSDASVAKAETANFAFFCDGKAPEMITQLSQGTLLEPEDSATVFYCVKQLAADISESTVDLEKGTGWLMLELVGPGMLSPTTIYVLGLDMAAIEHINATRRSYPLGVDIYLIDASGHCIGLPRTTRLRVSASANQVRG